MCCGDFGVSVTERKGGVRINSRPWRRLRGSARLAAPGTAWCVSSLAACVLPPLPSWGALPPLHVTPCLPCAGWSANQHPLLLSLRKPLCPRVSRRLLLFSPFRLSAQPASLLRASLSEKKPTLHRTRLFLLPFGRCLLATRGILQDLVSEALGGSSRARLLSLRLPYYSLRFDKYVFFHTHNLTPRPGVMGSFWLICFNI